MTTTVKKMRTRKTSSDAEIRVRVDARTKARAARLFKQHGLSTSDGIRLLLDAALVEKELPHVPNAETRKAMEDVRAGRTREISLDDLTKRLSGDA